VAFSLVQVLMETDNSGVVQAIYNYGNDLISMNRASVNSYYYYDGLGSVKQLTDTSETVIASYTYDGYGNLIASTGSSNNAYGFTGEQQFGEADGLVFLRARYYIPRIGRFMSRDPLGYESGLNLYSYCNNNPINISDPMWEHPANRWCHYGCAAASSIAAVACSLIPTPCAKAACLSAVAIGYVECNWRCDSGRPFFPPVPPGFGEPTFPIPGYPYPPGYGNPFMPPVTVPN